MTTGTEHEFSLNDKNFNPRPVSDQVIKKICGRVENEILFGDAKIGKELQKHVLEFIPKRPEHDLAPLERQLVHGIQKFSAMFRDTYRLLGLGMHPTLTLDSTAVWDYDEREYYEVFDRLFSIRQHGWLNIQALQINLSYAGEQEMVSLHNRLRVLLPYLVAVTASSPVVEGRLTGIADNRLVFYRENQKEIPGICNRVIPGPIRDLAGYQAHQEEIFSELRARGARILCEEWVNSSGIIVRFSRKCLEIKALDEQECIRSGMAVCAFVRALLRCRQLPVTADHEHLISLLDDAIRYGTEELHSDLEQLYAYAWDHATSDERVYLPVIRDRIGNGSLAEQMRDRMEQGDEIFDIMGDMARCLLDNQPYRS